MKKAIIILVLSLFTSFVLAGVSYAAEIQHRSTDAILSEIRTEQAISSSDNIDVSKVSQATLEELGDSVMEAMIGNTAMHEQMDVRLGGEGSESLKAFHIRLAINYLSDYPNGMLNIMSGGMMGNSNATDNSGWNWDNMMGNNNATDDFGWNWDNMMGNNNSDIGSGLTRAGMMRYLTYGGIMVGFFLLFLVAVIALIVFAILRSKKTTAIDDTTSEILGQRYANGEITKEEFDKMTKDIRSSK
ncbi:MAG: SHOCT domain-containing protein [Acetobacterium sp.]